MNNVILSGRPTKDPDLRYSQSGGAIATFNLAVDKDLSKDKKNEYEANGKATADFPRILAFGKTAEFISNYAQKGKRIGLQGRIQTGTYQDQDGKTIYTTDVIADRVEIIDWPESNQGAGGGNNNEYTPAGNDYDPDGDFVPFEGTNENIPF